MKKTKIFFVILAVLVTLVFIFSKKTLRFKNNENHGKTGVIILNKTEALGIGEEKYIVFNRSIEILNCSSRNKYFFKHSVSCKGNVSIIASMIGKYNIKVFLRNLKSVGLILYNITICVGRSQAQGNLLCGVRK